ncbi:MAG: helix-turn-helix domain-containing protein, partial [Leucobacter sp.]
LQVHRHTVRARLGKISELSGRRLGHAPDLLELWLAVAFREIADYDAPRPAAERDRQGQAAPSGQS